MNKPKGDPALAVVAGKDVVKAEENDLNEVQQAALYFQSAALYEKSLAVQKKANADHKNACKKILANLGPKGVKMIKAGLALKEDGGKEDAEAHIAMIRQIGGWMGMPLGKQGDLFANDRRPRQEVVYGEGFMAGSAGETFAIPNGYGDENAPLGLAWANGWRAGQASIMQIKELKEGPSLIKADRPNDPDPEEEGDEDSGDDDEPEDDEESAAAFN